MENELEVSKNWYNHVVKYSDGKLAIGDFDKLEHLLRPYMREIGNRAMYRGPRVSNSGKSVPPTMTMRCDATHVIITYSS